MREEIKLRAEHWNIHNHKHTRANLRLFLIFIAGTPILFSSCSCVNVWKNSKAGGGGGGGGPTAVLAETAAGSRVGTAASEPVSQHKTQTRLAYE